MKSSCYIWSFFIRFFHSTTMSLFCFVFFIWILFSLSCFLNLGSASWCPYDYIGQTSRQFEQKTNRFWEYHEQSYTWVEVELPYELVSCVDDNCTKVGLIPQVMTKIKKDEQTDRESSKRKSSDEIVVLLPVRKKISLTKMSEISIWVTGESGSIYERFWNGVQWVIAPHDLPVSVAYAVSVFIVNQTILALSEAGILYQMQLGENSLPIWVEFTPILDQSSTILIKSGVVSDNGMRIYFCTKNGLLLELSEGEPPRWLNHGRPPGADVAVIADADSVRPDVVYTISSSGDLYEHDRSSKPSWKKHIWTDGKSEDASLLPIKGCTLHGLNGDYSISLFLLTKDGKLVERRLQQRKWKWIIHGSPNDHNLTSISPVLQDESHEKSLSLFFTTSTGSVYEYRLTKHSGTAQEIRNPKAWINHMHPPHAKAARGVGGIQLQVGRILFPLDDGRVAELHLPGLGGENTGPSHPINGRRKTAVKYVWSIVDAPESEGWNTEYCKEERGPMNCIAGTKGELNDPGITRSTTRRRKGSQAQGDYLTGDASKTTPFEEHSFPDDRINANYRLRVMHGGRSFFLITDDGMTFEYLYAENVWLWLRHDNPTPIEGALGNYNGSLFLVDIYGSVLMRERSGSELAWVNCTAMKKLGKVIGGPPWDAIPGKAMKVTPEDSLFFVSKNGRLLQFRVSLRKFKWKDCRNPPNTKVASIVDQELFRHNIVFVIGWNGRLYQYNKVTELWHEHYQSQHLTLSRLPGTAMRQSYMSLAGSLFMLSEDGGLIEYHWNTGDGWNWIEHGTPNKGVTLITSPSPCFEGNQLFLVGSDGKVYMRYMDQMTWKWKYCGFPYMGRSTDRNPSTGVKDRNEGVCMDGDFAASLQKDEDSFDDHARNCDPKVAPTRPIPFSDDAVIFELRDGRLAEMRRVEDSQWVWSRTIGTPTSSCIASFWTAVAS